jgi:purine-nucleoside phosphorylase
MAIGIILGSGLGEFAEKVEPEKIISYSEIDSGLKSTVEGHQGRLIYGSLEDKKVTVMQGRLHYYEGYSTRQLVKPIEYMKDALGVDTLIITNAAGGINENFTPGDLMLINDHITSFVPSPLIGLDLTEKTGSRFHDMTYVYDRDIISLAHRIADDLEIDLKDGVYLQTTGPQYETPAEIRMFRTLGADAVGMSTTVEALYAHALGIRVCGISCITNMASGINSSKLSHKEVQETADRVGENFRNLINHIVSIL